MRKLILALTALTVLAAVNVPVTAAVRKPIKTKLFLHGTEVVGEADPQFGLAGAGYRKMNKKKPASGPPKSLWITNYVVGPNTKCAGNALFPVWSGSVKGTVVGNIKVTFNAVTTPMHVDVQVWPDVMSQLCDQPTLGVHDYKQPSAQKRVLLSPGENVVVLKNKRFKALASMMIQFTPIVPASPDGVPGHGRILYDSADFASSVEFKCIPRRGKSC